MLDGAWHLEVRGISTRLVGAKMTVGELLRIFRESCRRLFLRVRLSVWLHLLDLLGIAGSGHLVMLVWMCV